MDKKKIFRSALLRFYRKTDLSLSPHLNDLSLTAVGRLVGSVHTVVVSVTHPHPWDAALRDGALELIGGTSHLGCKKTKSMKNQKHSIRMEKNCSTAPSKSGRQHESSPQVSAQPDGRRPMRKRDGISRGLELSWCNRGDLKVDSRQSFSSSPSPQLSCPLQRKMPGMQRLGLVHLN